MRVLYFVKPHSLLLLFLKLQQPPSFHNRYAKTNFAFSSLNKYFSLYFIGRITYTTYCKVDGARKVSCLGKSKNERTHPFCGVAVKSVAIEIIPFHLRGILTDENTFSLYGLLL